MGIQNGEKVISILGDLEGDFGIPFLSVVIIGGEDVKLVVAKIEEGIQR